MNDFYCNDFPEFFCSAGNYHFKSKLHADYPINNAAFLGEFEKVKKLIGLGVEVDARGDLGYTALHHAVYHGYLNIVELLLKSGANPSLKTELGKSAFDLAILFEREDVYELLSKHFFF